jgi:hypothetical protein
VHNPDSGLRRQTSCSEGGPQRILDVPEVTQNTHFEKIVPGLKVARRGSCRLIDNAQLPARFVVELGARLILQGDDPAR